jgi:hypothetical protein
MKTLNAPQGGWEERNKTLSASTSTNLRGILFYD